VWRFARNLLWLSVTFPGFFLGSVFLLCVQLLLIMSSSGFSFEEFDSLLVAAAADVPSSSTPTARPPSLLASSSSLSSSSHGESSTVVMAGASFSGGVRSGGRGSTSRGESASPSKRVSVLLDPSHTALCLGLMASAKFCIRPLAEGSRSCGTAAHVKKFQPLPSSAFLKDTKARAFCTPVLDLSVMSPAQRLHIQGVQLTSDEWIQLFQQVAQHKPPKWLSFEESPAAATGDTLTVSTEFEILSPANVAIGGLSTGIPMLSFDESTLSEDEVNVDMDLSDVMSYIHKFRSHFASLKAKWARAFTEVEAGYGGIVQDLQKQRTIFQVQSQEIGNPVQLDGSTPASVWDGLQVVHNSISSIASAVQAQSTSIEAIAEDQTHLTQSVMVLEAQAEDSSSGVESKLASVTVDLRALENRVLRLFLIS
jgi:hypothetical protein